MKFTIGPQEAARLCFLALPHGDENEKAIKIGFVMEEFARQAFRDALERAKAAYREMHPGQCKMFSQGGGCTCFLCRMDDLKESTE